MFILFIHPLSLGSLATLCSGGKCWGWGTFVQREICGTDSSCLPTTRRQKRADFGVSSSRCKDKTEHEKEKKEEEEEEEEEKRVLGHSQQQDIFN
ncbi:hypothetical protein ACLKA7_004829 [Drosophila subpalustris]